MPDFRLFHIPYLSSKQKIVHCVIIGFSLGKTPAIKKIFNNDRFVIAENINAYLADAPDVFITSRSKPICDAPKITFGNKLADGGNFSKSEKDELIKKQQYQLLYPAIYWSKGLPE